jgi:hypothetical protein
VTIACENRLSPYSRGEDEGEGFEQLRLRSTLTLPLSLRKGEATLHAHSRSIISTQA